MFVFPRLPLATLLLSLAALSTGCGKEGDDATPKPASDDSPTAPLTATVAATSLPTASARAAATVRPSAAPLASAAPSADPGGLKLDCRVQDGDRTVELWLAWDKNMAKGELRTQKRGSAPEVRPVVAENYKELVLVDKPGSKNIRDTLAQGKIDIATGKLATLRVGGDSKKPALPCGRGPAAAPTGSAAAAAAPGTGCAEACKLLSSCKLGPFKKASDCHLACASAEDDPVTLAAWSCRQRASGCAALKRCDK